MPLPKDVRDSTWAIIEAAVKDIESKYSAKLRRLENHANHEQDKLKAELAGYKAKAETVDDLLAENNRLRQAAAERSSAEQSVHIDLFKASERRAQEYAARCEDATNLAQRCRKEWNAEADRRRRDKNHHKTVVKSWQDYHAALLRKRQDARSDLPGLISAIESPPDNAPSTDAPVEDIGHGSDEVQLARVASEINYHRPGAQPVLDELIMVAHAARGEPPPGHKEAVFIPSSQSTDDDASISPKKPQAIRRQSSGEVEIIAARPLKRQRIASTVRHSAIPEDVVQIKDEAKSSPLHQSTVMHLNNQESLDLDEVPPGIHTPRKRHLLALRRTCPPSTRPNNRKQTLQRTRSSSLPPVMPTQHPGQYGRVGFTSFSEELRADETGEHYSDLAGDDPLRYRGPPDPDSAVVIAAGRPQALPADPPEGSAGVLKNLDVNTPSRGKSTRGPNRGTKRRRDGGSKINEFSEDGDTYFRSRSTVAAAEIDRNGLLPTPDSAGNRLATLLEAPISRDTHHLSTLETIRTPGSRRPDTPKAPRAMHKEEPESPAQAPGTYSHTSIKHLGPPLKTPSSSKRVSLARQTSTLTPQSGKLKTPATVIKRAISTADRLGELRRTPTTALKPSDFRVNPVANAGHDHAFTDVIRNQEARRCLPGCTDPSCCGDQFRKMLAIGGVAKPQRGMWEPGSSQEDPDDALLRDYMGFNAGVLPSMTTEQRAEMLARAKTEELAKKIGRHKAQWQRAKSPPGFWRTDFPTTQEAKGYGEEAAQRERAMVEERRREAMRPGGKWKFADE